jgi:hypothetical protein
VSNKSADQEWNEKRQQEAADRSPVRRVRALLTPYSTQLLGVFLILATLVVAILFIIK